MRAGLAKAPLTKWDTTTHLVITGASGYIGSHLVSAAIRHGFKVTALARTDLAIDGVRYVPYRFGCPLDLATFSGATAVIHLAASTQEDGYGTPQPGDPELQAAEDLLRFCSTDAGPIFVFVSSQSARADAPSRYGQVKFTIEQKVLTAGGIVIRPGLVYGGDDTRALSGRLRRVVGALMFLPDFVPRPIVQPIHIDDLTRALIVAATDQVPPGSYNVAETAPISLTTFLRAIARWQVRKFRLFILTPRLVAIAVSRLGAPLLRGAGFNPSQLSSLFAVARMDTAASLVALEINPRPLPIGLAGRRPLVSEARGLLGYLLKQKAPSSLVRRYVRVVEQLFGGTPYELPRLAEQFPFIIRGFEARLFFMRKHSKLERRLNTALYLAEASPAGSKYLRRTYKIGKVVLAALLLAALVGEAMWLCVSFLIRAFEPTRSD